MELLLFIIKLSLGWGGGLVLEMCFLGIIGGFFWGFLSVIDLFGLYLWNVSLFGLRWYCFGFLEGSCWNFIELMYNGAWVCNLSKYIL